MPILRLASVAETAHEFGKILDTDFDGATVGSVLILVEVKRKNDYGVITSHIESFGDDGRDWIHKAMLAEALETKEMEAWEQAHFGEDEEDDE